MLIIYHVPSHVSRARAEYCGVRRRDPVPVRSVLKFPGHARDEGGGGEDLALKGSEALGANRTAAPLHS